MTFAVLRPSKKINPYAIGDPYSTRQSNDITLLAKFVSEHYEGSVFSGITEVRTFLTPRVETDGSR